MDNRDQTGYKIRNSNIEMRNKYESQKIQIRNFHKM